MALRSGVIARESFHDTNFLMLPFGELAHVFHVEQQPLYDLDQFSAGLGQTQQPLAPADEDLDAEFILQILDVFAYPRLGGEQAIGDLGQIEMAANRFLHNTKLLEIHLISPQVGTPAQTAAAAPAASVPVVPHPGATQPPVPVTIPPHNAGWTVAQPR